MFKILVKLTRWLTHISMILYNILDENNIWRSLDLVKEPYISKNRKRLLQIFMSYIFRELKVNYVKTFDLS